MSLAFSNPLLFDASPTGLTFASTTSALPILLDSTDHESVHIAARTFADDVLRVVGIKPEVYFDSLTEGTGAAGVVVVCTIDGQLGQQLGRTADSVSHSLVGQWESFEIGVRERPLEGVKEALLLVGSDKVSS
jgi:hypothetical protein